MKLLFPYCILNEIANLTLEEISPTLVSVKPENLYS